MDHLQSEIRARGEDIFKKVHGVKTSSIFNRDWWYGRIMEWSMRNEHFKTQMFRFVDVFPYLKSSDEILRHMREYFAEGGEIPSIFNFGMGVGALAPALMAGTIRKNIEQMAKMFITGETPQETLEVLKKARKKNLCFTVDILGEATLSDREARDYQRRYLELIDELARAAEEWKPQPQIDQNHLGSIPRINVSVKLSALYAQIDVRAWELSKQALKERLRPIFDKAMQRGVFINLDMENYELKDLTLQVFSELITEPNYQQYPHWGIVIQAYLRDSFADTIRLSELAKQRQVPFTVRLVKGAYWDYETVVAEQRRWPIPVYTNKMESDANYEDCARHLLDHHESIHLALGSHNVRSIAACLAYAEKLNLPKSALEIQMLYGMADSIKMALVNDGYRVREYAPMGDLIPGMAYLVRRLLENTSNESFLRNKFAENLSTESLLRDPHENLKRSSELPTESDRFYNEPLLDFSRAEHRQRVQSAIQAQKEQGSRDYPLVIHQQTHWSDRFLVSLNPSDPKHVIGRVACASTEQAEAAVNSAKQAWQTWRKSRLTERVQLLEKLADLIHRDRYSLLALEVLEVGKTWSEADGDIAEAIDFCRYYARDIQRVMAPQRVGAVAGEMSLYSYRPRGVTAVVAPWNFPLAILCGMVVGAVVTGNTVVMKPAEQSSVIAAKLMELLIEAGCPPGVVNFLPGYGEEVGEHLTGHKDVALIAFTGSKSVGLHILNKASVVRSGQRHIKRCIIEMGGKNAIIVDNDADLDEAIQGLLYSAFGFAGQKCSACSRVIVHQDIYQRFVVRLVEAAASLEVQSSENPRAYLGPVIDQDAQEKILNIIAQAKGSATLAFQGRVPEAGFFVPPTIFTDVDPQSALAQEEIFGPVLAVIRARDLDQAIEIANDIDYGLTGGVYSRSPANIEKIKNELEVGNLYINRSITGALVDRHPFGGFKLSGLGSKTGGPDYLVNFMEPVVITENTLRRGFAPSEEEARKASVDSASADLIANELSNP